MSRAIFGIIILLTLFISNCDGLIHKLKIRNDVRRRFHIENFGFEEGGKLILRLSEFKFNSGKTPKDDELSKSGFLLRPSETYSAALSEDNLLGSRTACLDASGSGELKIPLKFREGIMDFEYTVKPGKEALYSLYFVGCFDEDPINFDLDLTEYNLLKGGQKNYLSAGYSPLPSIYGVFTLAHAAVLGLWIFGFLLPHMKSVNKLHHAMSVLVFLKMMSLFFETIDQHYIKTTGHASGWNVPYYIFSTLKGIMLFILIALIGSGYQFVKPFLHDREKKIFLVVIPLQILDNIALIIIEETAPGSVGWLSWQHIFKIVDVICCGAIIIPIFWSIRHLRQAAQIDGKAAVSIRKLSLFRQFYLTVISYVYFTRIIVYLVEATLQFRMVWLGHMCSEAATLVFFCFTGYNFRPASDINKEFEVDLEEAEELGVEIEEDVLDKIKEREKNEEKQAAAEERAMKPKVSAD